MYRARQIQSRKQIQAGDYFEYNIQRYTENIYKFNVDDNRYTLVLARDNSGKTFWVGI